MSYPRPCQTCYAVDAAAQLVYVDVAGIDNRNDYPYGYCEIGQRFHASKQANIRLRVSWIAALQDNTCTPMTFTSSCNRDLFKMWLE